MGQTPSCLWVKARVGQSPIRRARYRVANVQYYASLSCFHLSTAYAATTAQQKATTTTVLTSVLIDDHCTVLTSGILLPLQSTIRAAVENLRPPHSVNLEFPATTAQY
eukprot:56869-Rhodomonas_salina.2